MLYHVNKEGPVVFDVSRRGRLAQCGVSLLTAAQPLSSAPSASRVRRTGAAHRISKGAFRNTDTVELQGLELDDPWGPFRPKPFYDTVTSRDRGSKLILLTSHWS